MNDFNVFQSCGLSNLKATFHKFFVVNSSGLKFNDSRYVGIGDSRSNGPRGSIKILKSAFIKSLRWKKLRPKIQIFDLKGLRVVESKKF